MTNTGKTLNNMASVETLLLSKLTQIFYDQLLLFGRDILEKNNVS